MYKSIYLWPFEEASNFWMKLYYFSRITILCNYFDLIFASFVSNQFSRSMKEREEDLNFFLYLHTFIYRRI
jgi:hypothetical protein